MTIMSSVALLGRSEREHNSKRKHHIDGWPHAPARLITEPKSLLDTFLMQINAAARLNAVLRVLIRSLLDGGNERK